MDELEIHNALPHAGAGHPAASPHGGSHHGGLAEYLMGFGFSIILTALPFAVVMEKLLPQGNAISLIIVCALIQIVVHLHYFLHIDLSRSQSWNLMSFVFTVIIVAILVGGSVWIMTSIGHHMMAP
ncbi:MAG: cytochrome o ubiquinol oxidase subunit IV [Rhizomicrobium sp.]